MLKTPAPVPARCARQIHARLRAQTEHILKRDNSEICNGGLHSSDQAPVNGLVIFEIQVCAGKGTFLGDILRSSSAVVFARTIPPSDSRIVVVRASVGRELTRIVVRTERGTLRILAEGKLQDGHAGEMKALANGLDFRGDDSEVLRDDRQFAKFALQP